MTFNTGNPIGSTDARDRSDNSENMDILENSTTLNAHPDRLGTMRKTRKGMELEHDTQIAAHEAEHDAQISAHEAEHDNQMQSFENEFDGRLAGMAFTRVSTFTAGATLTDMRQTLLWEVSQGGDGHEYGWTGAFPKVVPPASTPAGTGGVGAGAWVDRSDVTLRDKLGQHNSSPAAHPELSAFISAEADRAEAARDAAQLSAGVYATTAAGLAATTSGRYFSVPSADSAEYLILYLNNAGAAVEVKRYPSVSAVTQYMEPRVPPGYAWAVVDSLGRAAGGFLDDGTFVVQKLDVQSYVEYPPPSGYSWAIFDERGQAPIAVRDDGLVDMASARMQKINGISARRFNVGAYSGSYSAEINHIIAYGQSLSIGTSGSPELTKTQAYNSITLNAGATAFQPLTEPAYGGTAGTETTASGVAEHVVELIRDEAGISYQDHSYQILGSTAGEGGYSIPGLEKGGAIYPRIPAQIAAAKSIADSLGKLYALQAVTWIQGESDYNEGTSRTAYKSKLLQMQANIEADAKAITGQTGNIPLITYQVASHKQRSATYPVIALAQLDAVVEGANLYGACPMYIFDYVADNVHMPARSYKRLGAYFGLAYKRIVIDQQPWDVLRPISKTVRGAYVYIKFNVPVRPLKWDTTQVLKNANYGFTVLDSAGSEIAQVEEPVIINADTVKLHLASTPAAGVKIQYAFYGSGVTGRINGPRGNLRDSQGDQLIFKGPDNSEERLDNWCWIFEEII